MMKIYSELNTGGQHLGRRRKTEEIQKRLDSWAFVHSVKVMACTKEIWCSGSCKKIRYGSLIKWKEVFEFLISSSLLPELMNWNRNLRKWHCDYILFRCLCPPTLASNEIIFTFSPSTVPPCRLFRIRLQTVWQRNLVRKYLQLCSLWLRTTVALYPGPFVSQVKQRVSLKGPSGWGRPALSLSWMDRFLWGPRGYKGSL